MSWPKPKSQSFGHFIQAVIRFRERQARCRTKVSYCSLLLTLKLLVVLASRLGEGGRAEQYSYSG